MKNLSQKKSIQIKLNCLIIAEMENTGYIIGFYETREEAEKKLDKLNRDFGVFSNISKELLIEKLKPYRQYKINGKQTFIYNSNIVTGNSLIQLYLIDLEWNKEFSDITFNLELFIKERENTATLIEETPKQIGFKYLLNFAN